MASRIEQIIEEIEEYIDGCKFQALSSTKIVVNKEELEEMLRELRMKTPDEIKRYQKIISNKDAILADAQQKADQIIADAQTGATTCPYCGSNVVMKGQFEGRIKPDKILPFKFSNYGRAHHSTMTSDIDFTVLFHQKYKNLRTTLQYPSPNIRRGWFEPSLQHLLMLPLPYHSQP